MKIHTLIRTSVVIALCANGNLSRTYAVEPGALCHTNPPPLVQIVAPGEGEEFVVSNNIPILAFSSDFADTVTHMEFFAVASIGTNSPVTNSIGSMVNNTNSRGGDFCGALRGQYTLLVWSNATMGSYTLTAEAFGSAGETVTSAPVDISVVTDIPPVIRIVKPRDGATILGPTNITIYAAASDRMGGISNVEFFAGTNDLTGTNTMDVTNSLGVATNPPVITVTNRFGVFTFQPRTYSITWTNVAPGDYFIGAVATDTNGVTTTSSNVSISVVTNLPPVITLIPAFGCQGQGFEAPARIGLFAFTSDSDGSVTNVEFFAGTNLIGSATNGTSVRVRRAIDSLYAFNWTNVPAGTYDLTAVALSSASDSGTSAPVSITVYPPPPPEVKIVNPENGETFHAPANVYITAFTEHFTNHIASVQFLAGTNSLTVLTNSPWRLSFDWQNVPVGSYSLTAVATDIDSNTAISTPVGITVTTNWPGRYWHY
jgi:hypothetical protein